MPTPQRHYLREWRLHRGLSKGELAQMVGTSEDEIDRYEAGDQDIKLEMQLGPTMIGSASFGFF